MISLNIKSESEIMPVVCTCEGACINLIQKKSVSNIAKKVKIISLRPQFNVGHYQLCFVVFFVTFENKK